MPGQFFHLRRARHPRVAARAHACLRIERGANDTFELVLTVHGEEVTAYDLTAETVTTIGRKLLSAAA